MSSSIAHIQVTGLRLAGSKIEISAEAPAGYGRALGGLLGCAAVPLVTATGDERRGQTWGALFHLAEFVLLHELDPISVEVGGRGVPRIQLTGTEFVHVLLEYLDDDHPERIAFDEVGQPTDDGRYAMTATVSRIGWMDAPIRLVTYLTAAQLTELDLEAAPSPAIAVPAPSIRMADADTANLGIPPEAIETIDLLGEDPDGV